MKYFTIIMAVIFLGVTIFYGIIKGFLGSEYHDERGSYHVRMRRIVAGPEALVALRVRDVTELQRLGRARRDFVANISHDLRTPITTIGVLVDALKNESAHSARQRAKLLDSISDQTATLSQLAQELMDLSLIESGRMPLRLVDIPAVTLLEDARERMLTQAERKEIDILLEAPPQDLRVLADHDNICRVLQNLMHNAIKFSPHRSKVVIGAEEQGGDVRFWVRDWGPGISEEEQTRIFERFYKADVTRSSGGTGLGLAIARHIVEGHGGHIGVESAVGAGSTFWFTLIRCEAE
jgi:two-component system phosphate regulon sensor histidine kinase PhoR